jgi:hypothetical protein
MTETARVLGVSLRMIRYKVREFERSGVTLPQPQSTIDERPEGRGQSKGIA